MRQLFHRLWNDQRGFVVSAELVLILTIGVLGMVVGISAVTSSVSNEMNDVSNAIGALDQSYWYSGLVKVGHAGVSGSAFADAQDFCDCTIIARTRPAVKAAGGGGGGGFGYGHGHGFGGEFGFRAAPPLPHDPGCEVCGVAIQHRDGRVAGIDCCADIVLADGSMIPVAGVFAIRLADGTPVPLAAGFAVQRADGSLTVVSGATGIRVAHETVIPLEANAFIVLPDGLRVPLASSARRFAVKSRISLKGAVAVRLVDLSVMRFPPRAVLTFGKTALRPGTAILVANGTSVVVTPAGAPVVPAVIPAADVVALILSNGVAIPSAGVYAIRLADGACLPLASGYAVQTANGQRMAAGGATALRLRNGRTVILALCSAIRLADGTMIPLALADRRFTRGVQFTLHHAVGMNLGGGPGMPLPHGVMLRIGVGPLAVGMPIRLANGKVIKLTASGKGATFRPKSGNRAAAFAVRIAGGKMLMIGKGQHGAPTPVVRGSLVSLESVAHVVDGSRTLGVSARDSLRLANGKTVRLSDVHAIRLGDKTMVPLNVGVVVKGAKGSMNVLTDATGLVLRKGQRKVAFTEKAVLRLKGGTKIPCVGCIGPGKGCLKIDSPHFDHHKPHDRKSTKQRRRVRD